MLSVKSKIVAGSCFVLSAVALYWWRRRQRFENRPWKHVGYLHELLSYPLKSCAPNELKTANCTVLGLEHNNVIDRIFMITTPDYMYKNVKAYPHMTLITCNYDVPNNTLTLNAPNMPVLIVRLNFVEKDSAFATLGDQKVEIKDCGDDVANWLSQYILKEASGCRLVYYPKLFCTRQVEPELLVFKKLKGKDKGAFNDTSSFLLLNRNSLDDLKSRLTNDVACSSINFRPNFVVEGKLKPYEEDNWQYVKIGNDAIFECVVPCMRCVSINIDQSRGVINKNCQPLKTLKTYRQITDPKLRPHTGDSPIMGVHLALRYPGKVNLGDPVYVLY